MHPCWRVRRARRTSRERDFVALNAPGQCPLRSSYGEVTASPIGSQRTLSRTSAGAAANARSAASRPSRKCFQPS